jgi:CheY-like chemotaxis protein
MAATNPKKRLLVVDDDPDTLTTYRLILAMAGYQVATAETGKKGLELLQTEAFDLVLTDLRMPDLSGLELLAEAREIAPRVPVVIFTSWGSHAAEFAARHLGAADFIEKPWDQKVVVELIGKHVAAASLGLEVSTHDHLARATGPATRRWVSIVTAVAYAQDDVPTLTDWAEELGKSVTTLKRWCATCGVHAADSLDFARALRVVKLNAGRRVDWYNNLKIADPATMASFLGRAGLSREGSVPDLPRFLEAQRFITSAILVQGIGAVLP